MAIDSVPKRGVLCIPFPNSSRDADDAERLEMLHEWLIAAALEAGIKLQPVQGAYDSYRQIADRIYAELTNADLVVAAVREANPNVFFETGFAHGIGKPVLYVVRDRETIPFDIAGVEHFRYAEINDTTRANLAGVMRHCLANDASQPMAVVLPQLRTHLSTLRVPDNLYGRLLRHALDTTTDLITSWGDSLEIVGSEAVLSMGTFIMSQIETEGFATSYHSGHASWQRAKVSAASPDYFEATRKAVEREVKITRVYVIDDMPDLDEPTLRKQVWADASAGLDVRYMLTRHLPDARAIDFGLWDEGLVAEIHYAAEPDGSPHLHRCHYWGDRHRLKRAREWREAIEREALPCPDLPSERELLEESAGMFLGKESCMIGVPHKPDCSPYHTSWQSLRLCEVVSTPRWHSEFYTECFRRWSDANEKVDDARAANEKSDSGEPLNVLITGLADYAMLYWIAQSISPTVRKRCTFHILDLCQTPLDSCRWLQRRLMQCAPSLNLEVEVYRRDIFDNELEKKSYDLIASDAFLTRFEKIEEKRALMTEWMSLLRSGGMLVTTARVRERPDDITVADRDQFVQRVTEVAQKRRLALDVAPIAARYAEYIESYPFESEASLKKFVRSIVSKMVPSSVEFSLIEDREMTLANYGRIVVDGRPS